MSRSQKQKERLDADRQVNKEENVIQAAAGSMELSKRCELRNAERVLTSLWVESLHLPPPPTHTAKAGVALRSCLMTGMTATESLWRLTGKEMKVPWQRRSTGAQRWLLRLSPVFYNCWHLLC